MDPHPGCQDPPPPGLEGWCWLHRHGGAGCSLPLTPRSWMREIPGPSLQLNPNPHARSLSHPLSSLFHRQLSNSWPNTCPRFKRREGSLSCRPFDSPVPLADRDASGHPSGSYSAYLYSLGKPIRCDSHQFPYKSNYHFLVQMPRQASLQILALHMTADHFIPSSSHATAVQTLLTGHELQTQSSPNWSSCEYLCSTTATLVD